MTYETVLEVVFDGTDRAPLGRLLFPPVLPPPVRPRYVLPMDTATPVAPSVVERAVRWRAHRCGAVHEAKDRIWQMLEFPRTARDVFEALGLPENAVSSLLVRGCGLGVLVRTGHRPNASRDRGVKQWSQLYLRAQVYAHVKTWPFRDVQMTRTQRRVASA